MTEIEHIVDELQREHSGEPWHGSPLRQILEDVSAAQAAAQPIASGHSIWQLVRHITAWKNEVRRRLSGAAASDPEEGDWPAAGDPSDARWRQALAALERAHTELVAAVRQVPEGQLQKPTNDPRAPDGAGVSYYVLLHGIAQHDVYHAGQIAILKKGLAHRPTVESGDYSSSSAAGSSTSSLTRTRKRTASDPSTIR